MMDSPVQGRLWHVALHNHGGGVFIDGASEEGLPAPKLNDQQRLAVVMQGAALLAHLDHAGLHLGDGSLDNAWRSAELVEGHQLRVGDVRPGPASEPPHTLVLALLRLVFHVKGHEISGRGSARRAARSLIGHWQQELYPISPDLVITQILDAAPFLWQPAFAPARAALAGEYRRDEQTYLWLAGPGRARARFVEKAASREELLALLANPKARDIWDGFSPDQDPWRLYRRGCFRRAAAIWRRRRGLRGSEAMAYARALLASGRASEALEAMKRRRDSDSLLMRFLVQMELGERTAAKKTLHALEVADLSDRQLVRLAEMAIRLYASRGRHEDVRGWITKVLAVEDARARLGGLIVAASAAWDLNEPKAMAMYLDEARPALDDPGLAWRWHHAQGLRLYSQGDGPGAREHVEKAMIMARRRLGQGEAARLWNDVGVMRLLCEDLAGAERACGNVVRLMLACDGSARNTLALHNLASLRIRRGRLHGVEEALERSLAENRRAGNPRALICDLELQARFELARGRPEAALRRCAEAADGVAPAIARSEIFAALEGRARGWLGQKRRATLCLEAAGEDGLGELDLEERAAAWALAGQAEQALKVIEGKSWESLFASILKHKTPSDEAWAPLDQLEPYRAARLIHDLERLHPGSTPAARSRSAAMLLRRMGAIAMAEILDHRSLEPWRALRRFARSPEDSERIARLFEDAGYPETRLLAQVHGEPRVLLEGKGGPARIEESKNGQTFILEAPFADEVQETLLSVVAKDLTTPLEGPGDSATTGTFQDGDPGRSSISSSHLGDGIVGESRLLLDALSRLDLFADRDLPILILGESGTGKELIARRAHRLSRRADGPFMAANCAAFSESLIQSELFGHVRGAFTGAEKDRAGIFEAAHSGTVFLDEIGDLPLKVQGHLLRVLQEGEVRRVGESRSRKVNARVIAATHQGLARMVETGDFRRDLYYRLKVALIELPPLRERGTDVILIARSVLNKIRGGSLSKSTERALLEYRWPGNIRELVNMLEVAAALAAGKTIERQHLDLPEGDEKVLKCDYQYEVKAYKKKLVQTALEQSAGNQSQAARRLGLTRQALSYLVRQFGL